MVVYEGTKVLFDFLIHTLSLSISLEMICGRGICFNSYEMVKILCELVNKLWSSNTDNFLWKSVFTPDFVLINFSGFVSGEGVFDSSKDDHFGESVDDDKYGVETVGFW